MKTHADKRQENKYQSVFNETSQKQSMIRSPVQLVDKRPRAAEQRKLQEMANMSTQVRQLQTIQLTGKDKTPKPPHRLPPISERPTTARSALYALNKALSPYPKWEEWKTRARPEMLGGIPAESRVTGNDFAGLLENFFKEIGAEVPDFMKHLNSAKGFVQAQTIASLTAKLMSLTGVAAPFAPIAGTTAGVTEMAAGHETKKASEALSNRPASATGRVSHVGRIMNLKGNRALATGAGSLVPLPGASAAAGEMYDWKYADKLKEDVIKLINTLREQHEAELSKELDRRRLPAIHEPQKGREPKPPLEKPDEIKLPSITK